MYFLGHVIGIDGTVAQEGAEEGAEESPLLNTSWGGRGYGPAIILSINNCITPLLTISFSRVTDTIVPFDHFGLLHVSLKKAGVYLLDHYLMLRFGLSEG